MVALPLLLVTTASAQVEILEPDNLKLEYAPPTQRTPAAQSEFSVRTAGGAKPARLSGHVTAVSIPIAEMPTEDVDVVEIFVPGGFAPATAVWPVEGAVHFIDEAVGVVFDTESLSGPNISGVDFVSNGTWGVYATLGFLHIFDMAAAGGLPVQTVAPIALPGSPARRDIDPILMAHLGSPSGVAVVYATGNEIHCYAIPTGALLWSTPLPGPVVEAVDPVMNSTSTLMFVPTDGYVTAMNPVSGAILSTTALNTQLVRELDGRFVAGETKFYMPALGTVSVFSGLPPGGGGTGALLSTVTLGALVIEGNDMEVDPTGSWIFLPTLAFMYQISLTTDAIVATYLFSGASHERNQDVVFTAPGVVPAKAVYCTEGTMWIYDVASLGGIAPVMVAIGGDLIDGVDPAFTDVAPAGTKVTVSTAGFTHLVDVMAGAHVGGSPLTTPGTLRVDVDSRPAPVPAGKILQPALGGLWILTGFGASDWVVPSSGGIHVIDFSGPFVDQYVPTGLIYRGGDAQPTTLLGAAEPGYSVDHPDQDFLTKCWEYKYAINRTPVWWRYSSPLYYNRWVPYGAFGPPAQVVHDLGGGSRLSLTGGAGFPADRLAVLDEYGNTLHDVPLFSAAVGGIVWDQDNQVGLVRLQNQQIATVETAPISWGNPPNVSYVGVTGGCRWFPLVDRMNGWSMWVEYSQPRLWIYDTINASLHPPIPCPSSITRAPVFDDQRKIWAAPLANRTLAFVNTHRLRLNLPGAVYYSPDLGAQVVSAPVFDLYSHSTIVKLANNRIAIISNQTGALLWTSPVLPYVSVGPMEVDCYNMTALSYYRDPVVGAYYQCRLYLKDLVYNLPPTLTWRPVPIVPGTIQPARPIIGPRIQVDIELVSLNLVSINPLNGAPPVNVPLPLPAAGGIFYDAVNQYALLRLQGAYVFWMDIFRLVRGIPNATRQTQILDFNSNPTALDEDIVFSTRDKLATARMANGQITAISGISGVQLVRGNGFPVFQRQLFGDPFRGRVTYPYYDGSQGGHVTLDVTPLRAWQPGQVPVFSVTPTSYPPAEATDFAPPADPNTGALTQLPWQPGDTPGVVHFQFQPGGLEAGCTVQAVNTSTFNPAAPARAGRGAQPAGAQFFPGGDDPNEAQAEGDGSAEIVVVGSPGDQVCFTAFDAGGNGSGTVCTTVAPVVGVPGPGANVASFALRGRNPVNAEALFEFTLTARADVDLAIFDVSGRRVATLLRGEREAGSHRAVWRLGEGAGRPTAGVYFARIRSGAFEAGERVVVLP